MCLKRAAYLVVREVRIVTSHGFLLLSPWWDTQPHVYTVYLDPVISLDALVKYKPSTSLSQKCLPCKLSIYCSWFGSWSWYRILFLGGEVCFIEGWKGPLVGHLNPNSLMFFSILWPICECNHCSLLCLPALSVWVRYCWYLHYEALLTSVLLGKPFSMTYKHRSCLNNWGRRRQEVTEICIYHIFVSRRFFGLEYTKEAGRQM